MRTTTAVSLSLFALGSLLPSSSIAGFSNTHNLLAFTDNKDANLNSFKVHGGTASQERFIKMAEAQGEECMPALIVSAPTFSHDDLGLLPPSSAIRREWESAQDSMQLPYFMGPSVDNLKKQVARRFSHCTEVPIIFKKVEGYNKELSKNRAQWVSELDRLVSASLDKLPSSRIVLISSVPDLGQHFRRKRQITDAEWTQIEGNSELDDSFLASDDADIETHRIDGGRSRPSVFLDDDYASTAKNGNSSNSTVDPNAGLFYRYAFTSPALIMASLITLIVLVPAVMLSLNALTSIELVKGLEGKMVGGQAGAESKKDQ